MINASLKSLLLVLLIVSFQSFAGGSMRIEVEVYNGPLSKSLPVQQAELMGTLNLADHVSANLIRAVHISECRLGCFGNKAEYTSSDSLAALKECALKANRLPTFIDDGPKDRSKNKRKDLVSHSNRLLMETIFPEKTYWSLDLISTNRESLEEFEGSLKTKEEKEKVSPEFKLDPFEPRYNIKIPTNRQDKIHQVCPQLADVKANLLSVWDYIHYPLNDVEESANGILHCQRLLVDTKPEDLAKKSDARTCLTRIAKVGKLLSEGAEHWATTQVAILSQSRRARIVVARLAVTAAELGNELTARSDAIIRQAKGESITNLLPTSMYLRESEGTDYLNLMEWLDATPRKDAKWSPQSRTRMIERLINDSNWSKINTAFAQGSGKVNMVFVKDDIGNWNLKNYSNDPGEMLSNYKDIGINLAKSAAKLAKKASSLDKVEEVIDGVSKIKSSADDVIFGGGDVGAGDKLAMEEATKKRLYNTYNRFIEQQNKLNDQIANMEQEIEELEALKKLKEQKDEKDEELDEKNNELAEKIEQLTKEKEKLVNRRAELPSKAMITLDEIVGAYQEYLTMSKAQLVEDSL